LSLAPRNRLTREQRVARWNAAADEGRALQPQPVVGKGARNEWLRAVLNPQGELAATVRLVGAALVSNGNADGSRIYPGSRLLAGQCNLSQRAVCTALDHLVRRGYLQRQWKTGNAAGCGFRYVLTVPALNDVQHVTSTQRAQSAEPRSAAAQVLNHVQHGEKRGA
jgi:hypothetical protein